MPDASTYSKHSNTSSPPLPPTRRPPDTACLHDTRSGRPPCPSRRATRMAFLRPGQRVRRPLSAEMPLITRPWGSFAAAASAGPLQFAAGGGCVPLPSRRRKAGFPGCGGLAFPGTTHAACSPCSLPTSWQARRANHQKPAPMPTGFPPSQGTPLLRPSVLPSLSEGTAMKSRVIQGDSDKRPTEAQATNNHQ